MKLHENKNLFRQAIQFTADQKRIPAIYVEKDYWVTYVLHGIFNHEIGNETVFKGGTALSKCYNIIERFSEDIDLVVLRRIGESNNRLTNKIKTIGKVVADRLPEVHIEGLTRKMGMHRKTAHNYGKEFTGHYGQAREVIVVEASWLGQHEPHIFRNLQSLVGEMAMDNNQETLANDFGLLPFEVRVLEPTRTLCEKIMSLVRFSYGQNAPEDLKKKIRHAYDLYKLLQREEFSVFLESQEFGKMLPMVAHDDKLNYRNNNKWLSNHPSDAIIFFDLEKIWTELAPVLNGDFKKLVYGNIPEDNEVLAAMKRIKERLKKIEWPVVIE